MQTFWQLLLQVVRVISTMLFDVRYLAILGFILLLVHRQHVQNHLLERRLFGLVRGTPFQDTLTALSFGFCGGLFATFLFLLIGVSLFETGIIYLWMVALGLMFFHPRFLCFSYAGGIVSLFSLLFGFPKVDVPALLALVAILHLVEAVLVLLHGPEKAVPIYVRHESGRTVGAFSMQKFWPLPLVALVAVILSAQSSSLHTLAMPDWWPLLKPTTEVPSGQVLVFMLFPVLAALGYGEITMTTSPKSKCRETAMYLAGFSLILLCLALLASRIPPFSFLGAFFAPLGHEYIIHLSKRKERTRAPIYTTDLGIMVLDVFPSSPAEKMGLSTGDILLCVNGIPINSVADLKEQMTPWLVDPVFTISHGSLLRTVVFQGTVPPMGIIATPDPKHGRYLQEPQRGFKRFWRKGS